MMISFKATKKISGIMDKFLSGWDSTEICRIDTKIVKNQFKYKMLYKMSHEINVSIDVSLKVVKSFTRIKTEEKCWLDLKRKWFSERLSSPYM